MNIWIDIIFFYFPVLLGLLLILFWRRYIVEPKLPRIAWLGFFIFLVPGFGAFLAYIWLILTIVFTATEDIELDENKKFVKKWLKS